MTPALTTLLKTKPVLSDDFLTDDLSAFDRGYSPWPNTIGNRILMTGEQQVYADQAYLGTEMVVAGPRVGGACLIMARPMDAGLKARVRNKMTAEKGTTLNAMEALGRADWVSGMLKSKRNFGDKPLTYFEASIMLDIDASGWPAFWLLSQTWGWPPEIDIMEGKFEGGVWKSVHGIHSKDKGWANKGARVSIPKAGKGYHTYGALLDKARKVVEFYVDRQLVLTMPMPNDVLNNRFHYLLDLAIGGWGVKPTAETKQLQKMYVDWVRAWEG